MISLFSFRITRDKFNVAKSPKCPQRINYLRSMNNNGVVLLYVRRFSIARLLNDEHSLDGYPKCFSRVRIHKARATNRISTTTGTIAAFM